MKKQTKQFILWTAISIVIIITVIVVLNFDAFMNGFRLGGAI